MTTAASSSPEYLNCLMPDGAAIDTDALLKIAAYRLGGDLLTALAPLGQPAALGLTHLIAPKQLKRNKRVLDKTGAGAELAKLMAGLGRLEPTDAEVELAAMLAEVAITLDLPLDSGEAQLLAILTTRSLPLILTGDKRAIEATEPVLAAAQKGGQCHGKLACLEQALLTIVAKSGPALVRSRVCAEPAMDTAARICFGCSSPAFDLDAVVESLGSYIASIRKAAGGTLLSTDTISGLS